MYSTIQTALQLFISLGLLNVWLIRAKRATSYRGKDAKTLMEEFEVYGLPFPAIYIVGVLKVSAAVALLLGLFFPQLIFPASALITTLMVGAIIMHFKVEDPLVKFVPAVVMLALSALLTALTFRGDATSYFLL